jgi:light-regulated signal transduction histidine kinase (bacteriophytochrome)
MIYRFSPGGSGEVIAEAVSGAGMESFLGLQYPASDIPVQARALYLRNPFRIIADVHAPTAPLMAMEEDLGPPLDLSLSITRAVSPVHIEYLRNMKVAASMSISIIIDGALWGLIACHNGKPRLPTFVVRTAAELFGQMYSMMLEGRLRNIEDREDRQVRESTARMLTAVAASADMLTHASWMQDELQQILPCDGIAVFLGGRLALSGATPPAADIEDIAHLTAALSPKGMIFASDHIAAVRPASLRHTEQAAGVLCIPLNVRVDEYVMLFRREMRHDIKWAGEPAKIAVQGADIPRLSPRKSFAAFTESIRGQSRPFSEADRRTAESLRAALTDVVQRGSQNFGAERQRATERQEILIAELNHRVRNVLALIRGLISQTDGADGDATSYVKSLNGRVQALARAHDRVTRQNWGPGPLNAIFDDEIAAYVPAQRHRFTLQGAQILLQPQAFSTCALIIHELMTNSVKYGALSAEGRVEVTLEHRQDSGLHFKWREIDGPEVRVPTRRGFGSVIIERVVPFDLQGTALVQYLPGGLQADFFIPERHIALPPAQRYELFQNSSADIPVRVIAPARERPLEGLTVLLVEDNLIVALETEDMLRTLGATHVHSASTIEAALQITAAQHPHFAVLDVNLGFETSLAFANRLRGLAIPFIFASGYGESIDSTINLRALVVSKPYDRDHLALAISQTLDAYTESPYRL